MNTDDLKDLELRRAAERLGVNAAEAIDVERTVAGVLQRLRQERRVSRSRWTARATWLRVAAAVALLVMGALVVLVQRDRGGPGNRINHVVAIGPDLSELSAPQLQELLGSLDDALTPSPSDAEADLEGLTEEQLLTLMQSLEG